MTFDQGAILAILACTLAAFVWERWRFDVVAATSLVICVLMGLVAPEEAFAGFGNPAVVTVAAVLVIGRVLGKAGAIDLFTDRMATRFKTPVAHLAIICGMGGLLSAFMNNVAALALLLPVVMSAARRFRYPPSLLLMPLSFATLLGGMTTLIGTPANLLISSFRAAATGERFMMFDFAPTGIALALAGISYLVLVGWRFLPESHKPSESDAGRGGPEYATEARLAGGSPFDGATVQRLEAAHAVSVVGVVRDDRRLFGRLKETVLRSGDVLLIRADGNSLETMVGSGFELTERLAGEGPDHEVPVMFEAIIGPDSLMQGSTPASLDLARRWGVALIAVANQGRRFEGRFHELSLREGDVLLLEGGERTIREALPELGCLPLASRHLVFEPRRAVLPIALFGTAIVLTTLGVLTPAVAFVSTIILLALARVVRARDVYEAVDWPIIVLLAAMIPVGNALDTTGAAQVVAQAVLALAGYSGPIVLLGITLVSTMAITPVLNNVATAVVMAPIVISIAEQLGIGPDPFLIAVAIGASCDFVTPFGHHNNTIIMGLGNYRFGDYWRVGLPLDLIVIVVSLLTIPLFWRMG